MNHVDPPSHIPPTGFRASAISTFATCLTIAVCVAMDVAAWKAVQVTAHLMGEWHAHSPLAELAAWGWLTYGVLPALGLGLVVMAALRWPRDIAMAFVAVIGAIVLQWSLYGLYISNCVFWGIMWELA